MNFNSIRNQLKFFLKFLRLVKLGVRIIANQSYWTKKKMVIQTRNETYTGNNYAVLCRIEKTSIFFCFLIEKNKHFFCFLIEKNKHFFCFLIEKYHFSSNIFPFLFLWKFYNIIKSESIHCRFGRESSAGSKPNLSVGTALHRIKRLLRIQTEERRCIICILCTRIKVKNLC